MSHVLKSVGGLVASGNATKSDLHLAHSGAGTTSAPAGLPFGPDTASLMVGLFRHAADQLRDEDLSYLSTTHGVEGLHLLGNVERLCNGLGGLVAEAAGNDSFRGQEDLPQLLYLLAGCVTHARGLIEVAQDAAEALARREKATGGLQ